MTPPIKKRQIELERDSSSEASFDSPASDEDYDEDEKSFDFEEEEDGNVVMGKTFQAPALESQESEATWSPQALGTQPGSGLRLTTPSSARRGKQPPQKKRKVSLSPTDSLARKPVARRTSPRASQGTVATLVLDSNTDNDITSILESPKTPPEANRSADSKTKSRANLADASQKRKSSSKIDRGAPPKTATATAKARLPKDDGKASNKSSAEVERKTANNTTKGSNNKKKRSSASPVTLAATAKAANPTDMKKTCDDSSSKSSGTEQTKKTTTKKKKKRKRSFQDDLLELLFMSCKPFTVKTLSQQLKTNEASVNFCLLSLVDKGWVIKKEFLSKSGSRSKELYWANQAATSKELYESLQIVPPHEMEKTNNELSQLQTSLHSISRELAILSQELSNEDLEEQLTAQDAAVRELETRLKGTHERIRLSQTGKKNTPGNGLRPGMNALKRKSAPKKPVCPKRVKKKINDMRLHWKKRKEKCMDFIDQLADGMEKKVKDVVKILELETDEMVGVKMPPKHDI